MRLGERSMAELFISYSHSDRKSVSDIAIGLEKTGHQVWWDRRLRAYQDFGKEIEAAIEKANCAIVAWSATARNSLWVRAEATAAWESGKLVQLSLDGAKPPLPFTMVHLLDFSSWDGQLNAMSWHHLQEAISGASQGALSVTTTLRGPQRVRYNGFSRLVAVGAVCLALIVIAAGLAGIAATGSFSANTFGVISFGMLLIAMLAFAHMLVRVITIYLASR
jgi:TIR domain